MYADAFTQAQELGHRLVAAKLVFGERLEELLEKVRKTGIRLEWLLESHRELSMKVIAFSLWPKADPSDLQAPPKEVLDMVPAEWAHCHLVLPMRLTDGCLGLAMEDPAHSALIQDIQARTGLCVVPFAAAGDQLYEAIQRCYGPMVLPELKSLRDPRHPGHAFLVAFSAFWTHLGDIDRDRFAAFIDRWVSAKGIHPATGELLKELFNAVQSEHHEQEGSASCYLPCLPEPDSARQQANDGLYRLREEGTEHLYHRWNLLRRHAEELDAATVATLHASNLRDLHLLRVVQKLSPRLKLLEDFHRRDPDAADFLDFVRETQTLVGEAPDIACDEAAWLLGHWSLG